MATSKPKVTAPTDEELNQMLKGLEDDVVPVSSSKGTSKASVATSQAENDILAELENLGAKIAATSRPHTPRITSTIKRTSTPQDPSLGVTEDKTSNLRRSGESSRSFHTSLSNTDISCETRQNDKKLLTRQNKEIVTDNTDCGDSGNGGWWGSVFATASAAVKTAEAAMKEIQQNEEAKRWAGQVKDNMGALRGIGGQISSRAIPTFTNILHTLAPPISSHERLQIHITHDLINYPSLDPLIYSTFSRVMAQVEGGDLLVIQRGSESTSRRSPPSSYTGGSNDWNDSPWWRQGEKKRDIGAVKGLVEGTKLVRVSAEAYANEYFNSHGGLDEAIHRANEIVSESNPVRSSEIFLAVQAIFHNAPEDLVQCSSKQEEKSEISSEDLNTNELVLFAIYLHDPVHNITFHTLSQALPAQWIKWLDAFSEPPLKPPNSFFGGDDNEYQDSLPKEIAVIVESGGVDPREWVSEWVEEALSLATGVVAQRYVARRMGVGEGGIGKGKAKMEQVLGDGGGEAARAGLI